MTRRPAVLLAGLLVAAAGMLAGCVRIPGDGPVVDGRRVEGADRAFIQIFPAGPSADAGPGTLVREFLQAAPTFRNDHAVARSFLAPEERGNWRAESPIVIYAGQSGLTVTVRRGGLAVTDPGVVVPRAEAHTDADRSPKPSLAGTSAVHSVASAATPSGASGSAPSTVTPAPAGTATAATATMNVLSAPPVVGERAEVVVKVGVQARVDRTGQYTMAPPGTVDTRTFELIGTAQGWRIEALEPGILVSRYDFGNTFRALPLYFADPTGTYLVPDVRWFPVLGSTSTPSQLLSALLQGPAGWLEPAVTTGIPRDTEPTVNSVKIENGVATVDLTKEARGADARQRLVLKAQLERTLAGLGPVDNPVTSVVVTVEQQRFELRAAGSATPQPAAADVAGGLRPPPQVDAVPVVLDAKGAISRLVAAGPQSVPGLSALALPGAAAPAVDAAGQLYAVLVDGRRRLLVAARSGPAVALVAGQNLVAPSFDPFGWVWTAQRTAGTSVLTGRPQVGAKLVPATWLAGYQVLSLRISREGARAVVVALGQDGRPAVFVAGVVRTPQGVPVELTEPMRVLPDAQEATAAAWVDATHVVVLARRPGSAAMPWICEVGGDAHGTLPVQAVTVTAGNSESDLYVQTAAGVVRSRLGSGWSDVPGGVRWPAMPG